MFRRFHNLKGQAATEYMLVITIILFAFLVFQKYIARGLMGRWKASGDSFGFGRQYDPNSSQSCAWDFQFTNRWYDRDCYFSSDCDVSCISIYADDAACAACIAGCGC